MYLRTLSSHLRYLSPLSFSFFCVVSDPLQASSDHCFCSVLIKSLIILRTAVFDDYGIRPDIGPDKLPAMGPARHFCDRGTRYDL